MQRFFSILFCVGWQFAQAATENVTANTLYSPIYDGSIIVKSTIKSMIIVVLLIAFWIYWNKAILPNLNGGLVQNRNLQVIEKLQLDPTTAVYLIKVGDGYEALVASNRQIARLGDVSAKAIKIVHKKKSPQVDFASLLKQVKKSKLLKR